LGTELGSIGGEYTAQWPRNPNGIYCKQRVVGVERLPPEQKVGGSNPLGRTLGV
jgi:hypothetical protein